METRNEGASNEVKANKVLRFGFSFAFNTKIISDESRSKLENIANLSDDEALKSGFFTAEQIDDCSKHELALFGKMARKANALKIVIQESENLAKNEKYANIAKAWLELAAFEYDFIAQSMKKWQIHQEAVKSEFHFGKNATNATKKELQSELEALKAELAALKAVKGGSKA